MSTLFGTQVTVNLETMACGECGITFAVPDWFYRDRLDTGKGWYCPNGHSRVFRETTAKKLERQLASAREDARAAWATAETERRSHSATKGQLTKARKRAAAGVCPCCHRTFQQVSRHMASQHPDYAPE